MLSVVLACVVVLLSQVGLACPSPKSLGSDLTLIFQNDLNWPEASGHQGSILLSARNNSQAISACSQLGETLLYPNTSTFTSDYTHALAYLSYTGQQSPFERYWVGGSSDAGCQAVGPFGTVVSADCGEELPLLCSQSAPFHVTGNATTVPGWDLNPPSEAAWEVEVESNGLTVIGTRDQQSFRFLGIPYANPPERFTYSTLYTGSSSINGTLFRSQCTQVGAFADGTEDCLFLNIYTPYLPLSPSPAPASLKPVLFWIHGGGFTGGMGSDPTFDGGSLASRGDVVVVTINYRLSTLGFLALPDGTTNGSFGISDQVTALEWVQTYIRAFGGDRQRVTISGQSAGAASVRVLLGSPMAIGKFAGAILQSDPAGGGSAAIDGTYYTVEQEVQGTTMGILNETGCTEGDNTAILACLRAYDALALVNLTTVANSPVVDGTYVTTTQLILNGTGPIANVHVMMGGMRDDGAALIPYPTVQATAVQAVMAATGYTHQTSSSLLSSGLFPVPEGSNTTLNIFNVTARLGTDQLFRCLDQATAVSATQYGVFQSLWYYQFERSYQLNWWDPNAPVCDAPKSAAYPYGDPSQEYFHCHSGDLYLAFGSLGRIALPYRDDDDLPFAQQILDRWAAFIRAYDPNPDPVYLAVRGYTNTSRLMLEEGAWVPMTSAGEPTLRVLTVPGAQAGFNDVAQCAAMNYSLSYYG